MRVRQARLKRERAGGCAAKQVCRLDTSPSRHPRASSALPLRPLEDGNRRRRACGHRAFKTGLPESRSRRTARRSRGPLAVDDRQRPCRAGADHPRHFRRAPRQRGARSRRIRQERRHRDSARKRGIFRVHPGCRPRRIECARGNREVRGVCRGRNSGEDARNVGRSFHCASRAIFYGSRHIPPVEALCTRPFRRKRRRTGVRRSKRPCANNRMGERNRDDDKLVCASPRDECNRARHQGLQAGPHPARLPRLRGASGNQAILP